jgi:hypothetical protein
MIRSRSTLDWVFGQDSAVFVGFSFLRRCPEVER